MRKTETADILVIGAGIYGLACAYACAARGRRVTVLAAGQLGSGASGGPVGALSPYLPERWDAKKAAQYRALATAGAYWREVAATGGGDPGYARLGRLMPLTTEKARAHAELRAAEAAIRWPDARWTLLPPGALPPSLAPAAAPFGAVHETLSARLDPPRALHALAAALRARGAVLDLARPVRSLGDGIAETDAGPVAAQAIILAAGTAGFALMTPLLGRDPGQAVKGQAARLLPLRPLEGPMLYADGLYIVPHADGSIGVGATSESDWSDPAATDARLDALIARATAVCPPLAGAQVLARWAGLRPRGSRPEPMLGPLPGTARLFIANGAFRTGFGLAPLVGEALAAMTAGTTPDLPPGFTLAEHLAHLDILGPRSPNQPDTGGSTAKTD